GRQHEPGNLPGESDHTQKECGIGKPVHQPTGGDARHPGADEGNALPTEEQPIIAIAQGAQNKFPRALVVCGSDDGVRVGVALQPESSLRLLGAVPNGQVCFWASSTCRRWKSSQSAAAPPRARCGWIRAPHPESRPPAHSGARPPDSRLAYCGGCSPPGS